MKNIQLLTNNHIIKAILDTDNLYDQLVYDGSPNLIDYEPSGVWMVLLEGTDTAGFIHFNPMNNVMWDCHIAIFERYRGQNSEEWGQLAATWMKENLGAHKFLAITPYLSAMRYAERVGFVYKALLKNSIMKNGQLLDQYLLEL